MKNLTYTTLRRLFASGPFRFLAQFIDSYAEDAYWKEILNEAEII